MYTVLVVNKLANEVELTLRSRATAPRRRIGKTCLCKNSRSRKWKLFREGVGGLGGLKDAQSCLRWRVSYSVIYLAQRKPLSAEHPLLKTREFCKTSVKGGKTGPAIVYAYVCMCMRVLNACLTCLN